MLASTTEYMRQSLDTFRVVDVSSDGTVEILGNPRIPQRRLLREAARRSHTQRSGPRVGL